MYIKSKEIENNKVIFKVAPVFSNIKIVENCRKIVDDWFTFKDFKTYSQSYNFRKYCLEPIYAADENDHKHMIGVLVTGLTYKGFGITFSVFKSGEIILMIPEELHDDEVEVFIQGFERMISYVV